MPPCSPGPGRPAWPALLALWALLAVAVASAGPGDTHDSSRGVHHWSDEARGPSAAGTAAHPVPYPANATAMARSADGYLALVASLNSTSEGRQLIPLLPALPTTAVAAASAASVASSTAALAGDYLLGYSHNPWGSSAAFRDVLQHHLGDGEVAEQPRRRGRSVLNLYNMLVCSTGCNPMAFKGYGCYCGFLGSGYTVDGIDRCCKMHDWCYDSAHCPMFLEYFVPYLWKCYRGRPRCALNGSACSQRLCECDRRLAECLRHYPCPRRKAVCTSSPWRLLQNLFML